MVNMEEILELFKSDLSSGNLEYMVDAANKLTIVAVALGQEPTLNELFPYIHEMIPNAPDEVLVAFARQFWNIFDIAKINQLPANSETLKTAFACLRTLGQDEEIVVRDYMVESFLAILATLNKEQIDLHVFPLFRALAFYTEFGSRYTAASLLPQIYRVAPVEMREELHQMLIALSQDESPIVRAKLVAALPEFCEVITKLSSTLSYSEQVTTYDLITNLVIPILQQFTLDERDYLRNIVPASIARMIAYLPLKDYQSFIVPLMTSLADDLSWSVRKALCQYIPLILANLISRATYQYKIEADLAYPESIEQSKEFKSAITTTGGRWDLNKYINGIFNLYQLLLLHDNNIEVRAVGVLIMNDMFHLAHGITPSDLYKTFPREPIYTADFTEQDSLNLDKQFPSSTPAELALTYTRPATHEIFTINHTPTLYVIGSGIYDLVQDLSCLSKMDLCETFTQIAPLIGFEYINRYIVPVINVLAHDENVQVRASVIMCLTPVIRACPTQVVIDQIWPVIEGLGADLRWRVRRAVTTQISALCYHLRNNEDFITNSVVPLVEGLFSENAHAVRNRMATEFKTLTTVMGTEKVKLYFINWCHDLFNPKANYLHRITALHFMFYTASSPGCPKEFVNEHFNKYFLEALQDPVPNVKILAARYIVHLLQQTENAPWDKAFIQQILPHFQAMSVDPTNDREVVYQGRNAVEIISSLP